MVKFPAVFTTSISRDSMTLSAAIRFTDFLPVRGFGSWPRNSPAFWAWRRTKLLNRGSPIGLADGVVGMLCIIVANFRYWAN